MYRIKKLSQYMHVANWNDLIDQVWWKYAFFQMENSR